MKFSSLNNLCLLQLYYLYWYYIWGHTFCHERIAKLITYSFTNKKNVSLLEKYATAKIGRADLEIESKGRLKLFYWTWLYNNNVNLQAWLSCTSSPIFIQLIREVSVWATSKCYFLALDLNVSSPFLLGNGSCIFPSLSSTGGVRSRLF